MSIADAGPRPLLLIGAFIQFAAIMSVGGLGLIDDPSANVKVAIVALVTVFGCGFIFAWAPLTYVVTTEVPPLRLRDISQRTGSAVNVLFQFLVNFTIPYLLARLGSKVGFIFGSFSFCAMVFTYFCVPECKGKSLEEIDLLFHEGVSLRKFGSSSFAVASEGGKAEDVTVDDSKLTTIQHKELAKA
jgi:SP family sugar:H+ symporter-like MFS transporter